MKSRFSEEQIIGILKQQEGGVKTADTCREYNISSNTFYVWKSKFGGMNVSKAHQLKYEKATFRPGLSATRYVDAKVLSTTAGSNALAGTPLGEVHRRAQIETIPIE